MSAMNLLESILTAQNGQAIDEIGNRFGLDRSQAEAAVKELLPAMSSGLKRQAASGDGLRSLAAAVERDSHDRYLDNPDLLRSEEATMEGNGILGHLLGSKDASRAVAERASQNTGLSSGLLKQILPVLASLAMGAVARNMRGSGGGGGGLLGQILSGAMGGGGMQPSSRAGGGGGGLLGGILGGLLGGGAGRSGGSMTGGGLGGLGDLGDLARMFDADSEGRNADDILGSFFDQRR